MKKLANVYSYETDIREITTDDGKKRCEVFMPDYMYAEYPKRHYKTKMLPKDLPEHYCDVRRFCMLRECINAKNVVDMKYFWIKENHFMKDSILRVSYTGKLESYYPTYNYDGKEIKSIFAEYTNHDVSVFGYDIFKYIGYAQKYSNFDVSEIKKEFIKQCEWLKENEPVFAPDCDDFGEWFDDKIKID